MKPGILILAVMMVITSCIGSGTTQDTSYIVDEQASKIVTVFVPDGRTIEKFVDRGIDIINRKNFDVTILAMPSDIAWFERNNFKYILDTEQKNDENNIHGSSGSRLQFHTYTTMTSELQDIAATYPNIATLYELGQSVQHRTIWGLKITDNPDTEEEEPEVRICGCHHGNEYMSVELPLLLAWHLVENYGIDPAITTLVNERETWIIPMVNPDGRTMGTRENANDVDLNRDYGYMWNGEGGSPEPYSQPETQVIREHALLNNFVLSLSYHTTAAYINYLWNYKPQPTPEEPFIIEWAEEYEVLAPGLEPIAGYDWYQTQGDTNDFSYGCRGDIDTTIETANSDIQGVWDQNRDAMLMTIDWAGKGLHGVLTDADTGEPVYGTVWIEEQYWPVFTDPMLGDYHKPLLTGTYTVHYTANGYTEQIYTIEIVDMDTPVTLDVALEPTGGLYAFEVSTCEYEGPSDFANNPTDGIHALGPPDEFFAALGVGGELILDMGQSAIITDDIGDDFTVYEGDDGLTEGYTVSVGTAFNGPWYDLGTGLGTQSFDLSSSGLTEAQFVKIDDDGDGSASAPYPGFDVDAVESGSFQYEDDVGATEILSPEEETAEGPITVHAEIQNFGINDQFSVPVHCTIYAGGDIVYSEDFETDNGGYTVLGGLWQWGIPVTGPTSGHSGARCWGTNLYGDYSDYANARLTSTQISLPADASAELSYWQWYNIERGSQVWDGGNVKISTNGGVNWEILGSYLDPYPESAASSQNQGIPGEPCFSGSQMYWDQVTFDLSDYAGEDIMLRWHFGSDSSVHYEGWFIDDVVIETQYSTIPVYTATTMVDVASNMSTAASFTPQWIAEPGSYLIEVSTDLAGDQKPSNDKTTKEVTIEELIGFYLNLHDFPMHTAETPVQEKTGAAVAQMIMDYIWWNQTIDTVPPSLYTQTELYDFGILENDNTSLTTFDSEGMRETLQEFKPEPYGDWGYNFVRYHSDNQTLMIKRICQWINYTVGTYGGYQPGHPLHVPSAVPTMGDYNHWVAVRGFHSSIPAYPLTDDIVVYGFWINDPLIDLFGANSYKTIDEFSTMYYLPIEVQDDPYDGEYVAIVEPPEATEQYQVLQPQSPSRFSPAQSLLLHQLQPPYNQVSKTIQQQLDEWVITAAIEGITEQLLPQDETVAHLFAQTQPSPPYFVQDDSFGDYYLVPFHRVDIKDRTSVDHGNTVIVVCIDAQDGSFKEASWNEQAMEYLPVPRDQALQLFQQHLGMMQVKDKEIEDSLRLVHSPGTSMYYPWWMAQVNNNLWFISQDGKIFSEI